VAFCFIAFGCQYQCNQLLGMIRLRSDLLDYRYVSIRIPVCVEWDVKLYTLTHSEACLLPSPEIFLKIFGDQLCTCVKCINMVLIMMICCM